MSKSIYNSYSSVVPSEMSNKELRNMCTELQTAKNWNKDSARVYITSTGREYDVPVGRLADYQQAYATECGSIGTL